MNDWSISIIVVALIIIVYGFLALSRIMDLSSPRQKGKNRDAGTIVVNTTDPKKDVIRIELDVSVGELMSMKKATFQIENEDS